MYEEHKIVVLQTLPVRRREKHTLQQNLQQKWLFLLLRKRHLQLTPALLHVLSLTQVRPNNNPADSHTTFFSFGDEYAMQNVLSCNHRMFYFHCSGSNSQHLFQLLSTERRGESAALCGGHRERSAESKYTIQKGLYTDQTEQ